MLVDVVDRTCESYCAGSLEGFSLQDNITKKGDSFECWLGNQLYDVVARGATSSHSLFLEICFAKHDLRKL